MAKPSLEFWFDFASTYSYLAALRIAPLAEASGVEIVWSPFLLGPIFARNGWTTSPFNIFPARGRYMWRDMERLAEGYGLPLKRPPEFPQFALTATRVAVAATAESWLPDFCRAVFLREFGEGGDITADTQVEQALAAAGTEPARWLEASRWPQVKTALRDRVAEAEEKGIFGAPSFVTADGELFWGNDRLEQALAWATR